MRQRIGVWKQVKAVCILALAAGMISGCSLKTAENREALRMSGIEKLDAGDYAGAISDLEEALDLGKGRVGSMELDILKYRAEAEYKIGDYRAAAHTYDVLSQVDGEKPEYAGLHCLLSIRAGDTEEALEAYQKLYQQQQASAELLKEMGQALEEEGQTDAALELYAQAEADGTADSVIYNQKGLCYLERGEYLAAGQAFQTGLNAPDGKAKADLMFNYAVALEYQGEYEQALEAFEAYTAQFGSDEQAELEIAFLRTR